VPAKRTRVEGFVDIQSIEKRGLARECQLQERQRAAMAAQADAQAAQVPEVQFPPLPGPEDVSEVTQHAVPADNSCLFHAIAYLIGQGRPDATVALSPERLRRLVAARMIQEPERWNEVTMAENRTVEAYTAWITNPDSWGGFVDLIVLSECFQTQISVVSIESLESLHWTHYPDDAQLYDRRLYLLYNGVHYDAVVGTSSNCALHCFSPADEATLTKVEGLAAKWQLQLESEAMTIYECQHCGGYFTSPAECARHNSDTGHFNFKEIDLDDPEGEETSSDEDDDK